MNLNEQTYRIKQMMNLIPESKMGGIHNYTSFSELTDKDLYDIATWGLNGEYDYSGCETPECVIDDFKQFLNKPFPEELGNMPDEITIYRLIRLKNINDLNKNNLGKSWFSKPNQYEIPEFYDMLDHLKSKHTDKGDLYIITATTNQSNIDIPRTLWERSTQWWENEIVIKNDSTLQLINIKQL